MRGKSICVGAIFVLFVLGALGLCDFDFSVAGPKSRRADCRNSLKQMGVYFSLYAEKCHAYPKIGTGTDSWFAQIWRPDLANYGNLFRCSAVGKAGVGTHYWCIVRPGTWKGFSFATGEDLALPNAPRDIPIACDQLVTPPNHGSDGVNVLFLDGHVESLDASSPFCKSPPPFLGPSGWDAPAGTK